MEYKYFREIELWMDSIMPYWRKSLSRPISIVLIFFIVFIFNNNVFSDTLKFDRVKIELSEDEEILLDAQIAFDLNETISVALKNGVPLTFEIQIKMRKSNAWIWQPNAVEIRLRNEVRYRPLSGLYEVEILNINDKRMFATKVSALRYAGQIRDLVLVRRQDLDLKAEYLVSLDAFLDVKALPLPMRPQAYMSSDWNIEAKPLEWRLRP